MERMALPTVQWENGFMVKEQKFYSEYVKSEMRRDIQIEMLNSTWIYGFRGDVLAEDINVGAIYVSRSCENEIAKEWVKLYWEPLSPYWGISAEVHCQDIIRD